MKKLLAAGALALLAPLLAVAPASPASPASSASSASSVSSANVDAPLPTSAPAARRLSGTFMIGDSTTYRIAPLLRKLEPDWFLDYRRGRSIRTLPSHIDAYLRQHDVPPQNFIMALGTNRCHDPEWSEDRLRRAIAKLPRNTNVFLVMVVRAGEFQADKDAVLQEYNGYSRALAQDRPNTYIIDWRGTVLRDPTLDPVTGISSLLEDGTHETGGPHGDRRGPGVKTYTKLVIHAWKKANRDR